MAISALGRILGAAISGVLAANRDRWPFALPVGMGIGIGLYFLLPSEPPWYAGPLAAGIGILGALAARARPGGLFPLILVGLFVALGFSAASLRTHSVDGRLLASETPTTVIEGRIVEFQPFAKGSRVVLDHVDIAALGQPDTPARVRLRLRGTQPDMKAGDWVRVRGRLSAPSAPLMPGGFDFQRHAYFSGIGAVGFSMGAVKVLDGPEPGPLNWRIHLSNLRVRLAERVMAAIGGDAGAVSAALITGHRTVIPEPVLDAFRDAGLAHLLAISGLHIGLAAGIVFFAARRLLSLSPAVALRFPVKKMAALLALIAAFGYALMAGATVPTQRAFLIAAVVLIAVMVDRRGVSLRMLAWAATVILALQPESLLGPSFQMSFAAAIALVAGYEYASDRGLWRRDGADWRPGRGLALYAAGVAFTTIIASMATAPFVLYHFNQVAKFGLLANMVAVPVTALWVMPAAMMSFLLMPFGLEHLALMPMGWGSQVVIWAAERIGHLPEATQVLPSAPAWGLAALALGGLWLCVLRTRVRLAGLAGVLVFAAANASVTAPDLIVAADGGLAAVKGEGGGYLFSSLRKGRFTRENWLSHAGYRAEDAEIWQRDGGYARTVAASPPSGHDAVTASGLRCDAGGCILRRGGWTVAIAETPDALTEDCGRADLTIALVPARRLCRTASWRGGMIGHSNARIIDLYDLRRHGAIAVTLGRRITIDAASAERGKRPWVVQPRAWKPKN